GLSIRTASYCSLQVQFLADVEQLVTQLCATGEYVRLRMFPLPLSREALAEWDVDGLWKEEVGENEVGTAALVLKLVHDGTAIAIAAHEDLATVIAPILDEIQSLR
ncbi:MAG TPA: hypothetical protein VE913_03080, partial [Longimicrobium sp.]|nr:hypothetical protein [Longimicrobium sp.]